MLLRPQAGPQHTQNHKLEPYIGQDSDIIEISSDSEPDAEEMKQKIPSQSPSKKRTLSESAPNPPSKRQLVEAMAVIELLSDSDDNIIDNIPTINLKADSETPPIQVSEELKPQPEIKFESTQSKSTTMPLGFKLRINESAKDSEGRYIVTKKVKVDSIEGLSEVPKRWPVPPKDTTVAYVINLSEDKRWRDGTSKEKAFDRFLKQEVTSLYSHLGRF